MEVNSKKNINHQGHANAIPRWVSEKVYGPAHEIQLQTLRNWRYLDRQAGRTHAAPGFPVYRRFGRAVRYLIDDSQEAR
jgi:hypothetical protein